MLLEALGGIGNWEVIARVLPVGGIVDAMGLAKTITLYLERGTMLCDSFGPTFSIAKVDFDHHSVLHVESSP
jgi:hypothetical protein